MGIAEIDTDDHVIASSAAAHAGSEIIPDRYLYRAIAAYCIDDYGRLLVSKSRVSVDARGGFSGGSAA
jgi:hypothetical protein